MRGLNHILLHRDRILRAVSPTRPAALTAAIDTVALDGICETLVEAAEAKKLLCAKGWGSPGQSLVDLVRALPTAGATSAAIVAASQVQTSARSV